MFLALNPSVLGTKIPQDLASAWNYSEAWLFLLLPTIIESRRTTSSLVKLVRWAWKPALYESTILKLIKWIFPISSARIPDSPFLKVVKLIYSYNIDGFLAKGSSSNSNLKGKHGFSLATSMKNLKPNLVFEWAILFSKAPNLLPYGQISFVALGPSGNSLISYQTNIV